MGDHGELTRLYIYTYINSVYMYVHLCIIRKVKLRGESFEVCIYIYT